MRLFLMVFLLPCVCSSDTLPSVASIFIDRLRTDPQNAPSIPVTLVFAYDGPSSLIMDPEALRIFHQLSGRYTQDEIIAKGREATLFFKAQYGVDFTGVDDAAFLGLKNVTTSDGIATFFSGMISPEVYHRLISFTAHGNAIEFNNYVAEGGWFVLFHKPFKTNGILRTTIPANSLGAFASYAIKVGKSRSGGFGLPPPIGPVLVIDYQSSTVFYPFDPLTLSVVIDCDIQHPLFGKGKARGVGFTDVTDAADFGPKTLFNGKNVLSFPEGINYSGSLLKQPIYVG